MSIVYYSMTEINNIIEENKENEEVKLTTYQRTKLWRQKKFSFIR